ERCSIILLPCICLLGIRSLKRTAIDKALNNQATMIEDLSLAVGFSRRILNNQAAFIRALSIAVGFSRRIRSIAI
ncbi:MAG: hypothetical protein PHG29_10635, partial [Prolixibacteraceae bacterium]|nr:hypothetical protein [Prolixibacteraceae bacterium]